MRYLLIIAALALAGCESTQNPLDNPYVQALGRGMQGYGNHMQAVSRPVYTAPRTCTYQNSSGIVGQPSKTTFVYC